MNHQDRVGTESVTTSLDSYDPWPGDYLRLPFFPSVPLVIRIFAKHTFRHANLMYLHVVVGCVIEKHQGNILVSIMSED